MVNFKLEKSKAMINMKFRTMTGVGMARKKEG